MCERMCVYPWLIQIYLFYIKVQPWLRNDTADSIDERIKGNTAGFYMKDVSNVSFIELCIVER